MAAETARENLFIPSVLGSGSPSFYLPLSFINYFSFLELLFCRLWLRINRNSWRVFVKAHWFFIAISISQENCTIDSSLSSQEKGTAFLILSFFSRVHTPQPHWISLTSYSQSDRSSIYHFTYDVEILLKILSDVAALCKPSYIPSESVGRGFKMRKVSLIILLSASLFLSFLPNSLLLAPLIRFYLGVRIR